MEGLMNKVGKGTDVIIIGAAIVDLPLRPVSKEVFDTVSYPVDGISMTIGGDAINEATIITRLGHKVSLMSCIGVDVAGAFVLGGQMAFVSSVADGRAVAAYFAAKLSAGILAVWLAARFTRNVPQKNTEK